MSTNGPEFRPVELSPKKAVWPFAIIGAAVVAALVFYARRDTDKVPVKQAVLASVAPKPEAPPAAPAEPKPEPAKAEAPKIEAAKGPNVIGGAVAAAARAAGVVPATELDRERARTRGVQKAAATYKKQIDELNKQLAQARGELQQARGQISALQNPAQPPPSDQEQILRTLAPVLGNADARN
jgi:hypothetical protein